ncbi:MAG: triose-phosphate isomerase [Candidatus Liptonbacteria bacterium]
MKKLVVFNWKMNPASRREAEELFAATERESKKVKGVDVAVCPPYVYLPCAPSAGSHFTLGAQDIFWEPHGAFTGEISASMLVSMHAEYVIVGHSERRKFLGETDSMIQKKMQAAVNANIVPIFCVGETGEVRKQGIEAAKEFVGGELEEGLLGYERRVAELVIAYEPIWAIGNGKADKPRESAEMVEFIKKFMKKHVGFSPRVLYGGSVDGKNAAGFLSEEAIDGALVGGASLHPADIKKIINFK